MLLLFASLIDVVSTFSELPICSNFSTAMSANWTSSLRPPAVLLNPRPGVVGDPAIRDAECVLRKRFTIVGNATLDPNLSLCYQLANVPTKVGVMLVALSRDVSIGDYAACVTAVYGPLPDVLFVNFPRRTQKVDKTFYADKSAIFHFFTKGGALRVEVDYNREVAANSWAVVLNHFVRLGDVMPSYKHGMYGFNRTFLVRTPPVAFAQLSLTAYVDQLLETSWPISVVLIIASLPMICLACSVSGFLVFQPRDGVIYSSDEIEFTTVEIEDFVEMNEEQEAQKPVISGSGSLSTEEEKAQKKKKKLAAARKTDKEPMDRTQSDKTKTKKNAKKRSGGNVDNNELDQQPLLHNVLVVAKVTPAAAAKDGSGELDDVKTAFPAAATLPNAELNPHPERVGSADTGSSDDENQKNQGRSHRIRKRSLPVQKTPRGSPPQPPLQPSARNIVAPNPTTVVLNPNPVPNPIRAPYQAPLLTSNRAPMPIPNPNPNQPSSPPAAALRRPV